MSFPKETNVFARSEGRKRVNRKQKLLLNSGTGLLKQLTVVICGFILPRYMLLYYGSDVNGLVSSIAHFLGFISLLELGIGPVIQANLYKPLAEKNDEQISRIIISSERFFRRIAVIFVAYIAVLAAVFPVFVNTKYDAVFTASLIVIIATSTLAEYFFGATYQLLLNADQKSYVQTSLQIIATILNTVCCIVIMHIGAPVHMVKLVSSLIFVLRPVGQAIYVHKHYHLNKKLVLTEEPIKQKWNGFAQHLAAVICGNADVVILTIFSTLANVSVYSVYYNVTNGVTMLIMTATTGLEAYFGNMMAKGERKNLERAFSRTEWLIHFVVTVVFTVAAVTVVPFVSVYTRGINDADYIVPLFGITLMLAYASRCLRVPYFIAVKAAGHFRETQNGAFISTALNVVISIALVFRFGLVGIALGTLVAMLYHTVYFVLYLRGHILNRPLWHFAKHFVSDLLIFGLSFLATKSFALAQADYLSWVVLAVKVGTVTLCIAAVVNIAFNFKTVMNCLRRKRAADNRD